MMTKCDNKSVGTVIKNERGQIVLLKRAMFPVGIAPPAGHIDDHGTPEQTALAETYEELGLTINPEDLHATSIVARYINNHCRRPGGDHHLWWVYTTNKFSGTLHPDTRETKGAKWYDRTALQALANRTKEFRAGKIPHDLWQNDPGLEEVWLDFLIELRYVK